MTRINDLINEWHNRPDAVVAALVALDEPRGPAWGSSGKDVYERTYQRTKPDGSRETWYDTVVRVVDGNLGLVDPKFIEEGERDKLIQGIYDFEMLPAGRHLWASGVKGAQYLTNCFVSHWTDTPSEHFEFSFLRAMEGGGVGTNYSTKYLPTATVNNELEVHIVCDPWNPDYEAMEEAGLLSHEYGSDWSGAYEIEDSRQGWATAIVDLIDTFFRDDVKHRRRVYDITRIRPAGARLKTFGGTASGPAPLARALIQIAKVLSGEVGSALTPLVAMELDHILAECVVSGGVRRTARMSVVEWDDPFIFEFISCKADTSKHWSTNISVGLTQGFFDALTGLTDDPTAGQVLHAVAEGMLANGEPGFVNLGLAQVTDPDVVCTNPCGEQFLSPWDSCNLGHVNLDKFYEAGDDAGRWLDLLEAHRLMARFLVRATFGDKTDAKQAEAVERNRRIGVGHFGFAAYLAKNGIRYSEAAYDRALQQELQEMYEAVRDEARTYAFEMRIPEPLKVTTVAPTGSIAKLPGTTEGIHPVMYRHFIRRIRFSTVDARQAARLAEYEAEGYKVEPDLYAANTGVVEIPTEDPLVGAVRELGLDPEVVESAEEVSVRDMLEVLRLYQTWYADNAVSVTINVDPQSISESELAELLREYLPEVKGVTVFPAISRPQSPYEAITEDEYRDSLNRAVADSVDESCSSGACPIR